MTIPKDLLYSKEHEWLRIEGNVARIGVTDYAQNAMGDVVFVELPEENGELDAGDSFGVIESVKAVSDIYAPVAGKVIKINEKLLDSPELINEDPYGEGWIVELEVSGDLESMSLMSAEEYEEFLKKEA